MNNELLQILSKMNGGSILSGKTDDWAKKDSNVSLLIDDIDNKYYFFAEYILEGEDDNYDLIEKATIQNQEIFISERVSPSDAYLILFWKVDEINESVYSKVIEFEENEMFYKKYIIYYTNEELRALNDRLNKYGKVNLCKLIEDISNEDELTNDWKLAIRIMIKIPFWSLTFPSAIMVKFEEKVEQLINRTTKNINTNDVLKLKQFIDEEMCETDELIDKIIFRYLGDFS